MKQWQRGARVRLCDSSGLAFASSRPFRSAAAQSMQLCIRTVAAVLAGRRLRSPFAGGARVAPQLRLASRARMTEPLLRASTRERNFKHKPSLSKKTRRGVLPSYCPRCRSRRTCWVAAAYSPRPCRSRRPSAAARRASSSTSSSSQPGTGAPASRRSMGAKPISSVPSFQSSFRPPMISCTMPQYLA